MRYSPLIAFVLLPIMAGCAASLEPLGENGKTRMEHTAELLSRRTDADSLAAAGLLSAVGHQDQSLRLITQASLKAPERADLLWLHIQFCQADVSCDPEPLERRLRVVDEKNGAGWLGALARASKRGDEEAKSAALAAIARSERVDTYWTTLIARLSPQIASTKTVSLIDAEFSVMGVLAAVAIPAYAVATNDCKGERVLLDDVVEVCRGVANSLLNGDTVITEMVGVSIALRAWPENSAKWLEAAEARRIWDYRRQFAQPADAWSRAHASDYLALCEEHHREQDVYKAVLIAIGKNPDPPKIQGEPVQAK